MESARLPALLCGFRARYNAVLPLFVVLILVTIPSDPSTPIFTAACSFFFFSLLSFYDLQCITHCVVYPLILICRWLIFSYPFLIFSVNFTFSTFSFLSGGCQSVSTSVSGAGYIASDGTFLTPSVISTYTNIPSGPPALYEPNQSCEWIVTPHQGNVNPFAPPFPYLSPNRTGQFYLFPGTKKLPISLSTLPLTPATRSRNVTL